MRLIAGNVVLAIVYVVAARLGLMMDAVSGFATLVWAPTGIALAAILLFGFRMWPGIAAGAFAANAWSGAPLPIALGIAFGNTGEALAGGWLLRRADFHPSIDRLRDVVALTAAALLITMVSATIGVLSLHLGGLLQAEASITWRAWWLGDAIGALIVAPLLLTWRERRPFESKRILEAAALALATMISSALIMARWGPNLIIPSLIWAAVRFDQRAVTLTTFAASAFAIAGAAIGIGPFALGTLHESLTQLQAFMGVVAATALVLGAVIAERRRAQEVVVESLRLREEFLSVAAHELRTPLSALVLEVDGLNQKKDQVEAKIAKQIERAARVTVRLTRLVDLLLDATRVAAGHLHLERQQCDLAEIAREVAERMKAEAEHARCALEVRAEAPVVASCDRERIDQAVTNLLSNAIKYGAGKPVELSVGASAGRAVISARDQGMGIAPEDMARLFSRFERAVPVRRYGGLGLGLYITRQIVEAHGGTVRAESKPGEGARFVIELPLEK